LKVPRINGDDLISGDNDTDGSCYAVAVAAGLGAAVTANRRLRLYNSWLGVFWDVPQTLAVLVNLWFYVTPIIYPAKMVPGRSLVFG